MRKIVNRDNLAKELAPTLGLSLAKTKVCLITLEKIIIQDLKTKSRVTITDFGTFYLRERKSRTIKQIKTKQNRLLLERKAVKFKAAKTMKELLYKGLPEEPTLVKDEVETKIDSDSPKIEPVFKTTHEEFSSELPTNLDLDKTPYGRMMASLIKQAGFMSATSFNYSLTDDENTLVYTQRPRKLIGSIPTKLLERFNREYLQISHSSKVEQRNLRVFSSSKAIDDCYLDVHCLPTCSGISMNVLILFKKL